MEYVCWMPRRTDMYPGVLLTAANWELSSAFDSLVYKLISGCISDRMTRFMKLVTFMGSGWSLTVLAIAIPFSIFILEKKKYYTVSLMVSLNISVGALLNHILKLIFHRPRPDVNKLIEIGGYSFPSGHSMNSTIFYGFLIYLIFRYMPSRLRYPLAGILCLLISLIGISRIYLGVHYASDVVAGFVFGLIWLAFFIPFTERFIMNPGKKAKTQQ